MKRCHVNVASSAAQGLRGFSCPVPHGLPFVVDGHPMRQRSGAMAGWNFFEKHVALLIDSRCPKRLENPRNVLHGFSENDQLHHHKPCNSHGEITFLFLAPQRHGPAGLGYWQRENAIPKLGHPIEGMLLRQWRQWLDFSELFPKKKKTNNSNGQVIRFSQHLVIKRIKLPFSDRPVDVLTGKPWFHPCREATKTWNHSQSGSFQSLFASKLEVFSSMPNMGGKKQD